jgi:hypothetical protein
MLPVASVMVALSSSFSRRRTSTGETPASLLLLPFLAAAPAETGRRGALTRRPAGPWGRARAWGEGWRTARRDRASAAVAGEGRGGKIAAGAPQSGPSPDGPQRPSICAEVLHRYNRLPMCGVWLLELDGRGQRKSSAGGPATCDTASEAPAIHQYRSRKSMCDGSGAARWPRRDPGPLWHPPAHSPWSAWL